MTAPLQFPICQRAIDRADAEWDHAAMNAARTYGCWLLGDTLPHWLVVAWENWLKGRRDFGLRAHDVRWSALWSDFVGSMMFNVPAWQRAVEISMRDVEDAA